MMAPPQRRLRRLLLVWNVLLVSHSLRAWEDTWESLDSRPLPTWYEEAKFGIFIHWGIFSVPSFGNPWFWYHWQAQHDKRYRDFVDKTEKPRFAYTDYAHRFDTTLYRPDVWADAFAKSGAQYVVLTSKHHEGFCNWDSRNISSTWNWNAMDVGPRRDLVGDLAKSIKRVKSPHTNTSLHFGLYHSLFEWFNPGYLKDKASNFTASDFVDTKTMPELYDLVRKYQPELIWSDGDWEAHSKYWKSTDFLAWYATHSAVANTAVWNDRWGKDALCKHGSFVTCSDRYQPGMLSLKKWENALTINARTWSFDRNASFSSYLSTAYLIHELIETVAYNGNMLLNVAPFADGTISPIFLDRLQGIGEWLGVNGGAIYATRPWTVCQNETNVYYTTKGDTLYAIATRWPPQNKLFLNVPKPSQRTKVHMLGLTKELDWTARNEKGGLYIQVPALTPDVIPCQHAWVVSLTNIVNLHQAPPITEKEY